MTLLIVKRSHFGSSWFPVWKGASRVSSTDLNVIASFTSTVRARISHQTHWLSWLALRTVSPRPLSAPRSKSTERKFWLAPSLRSFLKLDVTLRLHFHFKRRPTSFTEECFWPQVSLLPWQWFRPRFFWSCSGALPLQTEARASRSPDRFFKRRTQVLCSSAHGVAIFTISVFSNCEKFWSTWGLFSSWANTEA